MILNIVKALNSNNTNKEYKESFSSFDVPENYFDELENKVLTTVGLEENKRSFRINRMYRGYGWVAAAAMILVLISIGLLWSDYSNSAANTVAQGSEEVFWFYEDETILIEEMSSEALANSAPYSIESAENYDQFLIEDQLSEYLISENLNENYDEK